MDMQGGRSLTLHRFRHQRQNSWSIGSVRLKSHDRYGINPQSSSVVPAAGDAIPTTKIVPDLENE